jgi:hypothetical protein
VPEAATADQPVEAAAETADPASHRRELIENAIEELTELRNRLARLLG